MRISVFRKAHFNAAHRLFVPEWDDEKNLAVFGLCSNPNYHGHNYEMEVKLTGEVDPTTGFLYDLKEFKTRNPTAENICFVIWEILRKHIDQELEITVRLWETPRNYVEYPA